MRLTKGMRAMRNRGGSFNKQNATYIDASTAFSLLGKNNVKFLDVRNTEQYDKERIPTAQNAKEILNFRSIYEKQGLETVKQYYQNLFASQLNIKKDDHIIAYENSLQSQWGPHLSYFVLNYLGFSKISILDGGIESWKSRNLEIENTQKQQQIMQSLYPVYDYQQINDNFVATSQNVQENLRKMDKVLIDVREEVEFNRGRIPSAINIPLSKIFKQKSNGIFINSENSVESIMEKNNIYKSDKLIVYSQSGQRSAQFQAALENYGFGRIQNYTGALNEWSRFSGNNIQY